MALLEEVQVLEAAHLSVARVEHGYAQEARECASYRQAPPQEAMPLFTSSSVARSFRSTSLFIEPRPIDEFVLNDFCDAW